MAAQKRDEAGNNYKAALETANAAKAQWIKAKKGTRSEDKDAAESMVNRAKGAINEVESYVNECRIYAPANGEVADIIAEIGELVSAGYPVITLAKLDDSWVTLIFAKIYWQKLKWEANLLLASFPALGNKELN